MTGEDRVEVVVEERVPTAGPLQADLGKGIQQRGRERVASDPAELPGDQASEGEAIGRRGGTRRPPGVDLAGESRAGRAVLETSGSIIATSSVLRTRTSVGCSGADAPRTGRSRHRPPRGRGADPSLSVGFAPGRSSRPGPDPTPESRPSTTGSRGHPLIDPSRHRPDRVRHDWSFPETCPEPQNQLHRPSDKPWRPSTALSANGRAPDDVAASTLRVGTHDVVATEEDEARRLWPRDHQAA